MYTRLVRRLEAGDDRLHGRPAIAGRIPFGYGFTPVRSLLFPRRPWIVPAPRWSRTAGRPLEGC